MNDIINKCSPYTMTNVKRMRVLCDCVDVICKENIPGDLVETGVYKGGSSMIMAEVLKLNNQNRKIYMYDTYAGMSKPSEYDYKNGKKEYLTKWEQLNKGDHVNWCYSSLDDVKKNMSKTGYENVEYIVGKVEETLNEVYPEEISILRIDTDFYESIKKALEVLYPRLSKGGYLILDDYNCWNGANKAVNDYFAELKLSKEDLITIDQSAVYYKK